MPKAILQNTSRSPIGVSTVNGMVLLEANETRELDLLPNELKDLYPGLKRLAKDTELEPAPDPNAFAGMAQPVGETPGIVPTDPPVRIPNESPLGGANVDGQGGGQTTTDTPPKPWQA